MHENGDLLETAGAVTSSLDAAVGDNRLQLRRRGFLGRFLNPCFHVALFVILGDFGSERLERGDMVLEELDHAAAVALAAIHECNNFCVHLALLR